MMMSNGLFFYVAIAQRAVAAAVKGVQARLADGQTLN